MVIKGGYSVKIVFASTPGQEMKVQELVEYFYAHIFPRYFADEEIWQFEKQGVLKPMRTFDGLDTLKDGFQIITCLQTIISILEAADTQCEYEAIFDKNASMLEEMGLHFPFTFSDFSEASGTKVEMLSIYTPAANQYLI
jgi:hypothetical protein